MAGRGKKTIPICLFYSAYVKVSTIGAMLESNLMLVIFMQRSQYKGL